MRIVNAMNTWNPALHVLEGMGFALQLRLDPESEGIECWHASKGGDVFESDDPVSLLGLCMIGESRGEDWRAKVEEENLVIALLERASETAE